MNGRTDGRDNETFSAKATNFSMSTCQRVSTAMSWSQKQLNLPTHREGTEYYSCCFGADIFKFPVPT